MKRAEDDGSGIRFCTGAKLGILSFVYSTRFGRDIMSEFCPYTAVKGIDGSWAVWQTKEFKSVLRAVMSTWVDARMMCDLLSVRMPLGLSK